MAGPGHRPTNPQPAPNRTEPRISPRSSSGRAGAGNVPQVTGWRVLVMRHATNMGRIAPPMTKASVGSHAPKISSQPCTFWVSVIPDSNSPAPKSAPDSKAINNRIRSPPNRGGTTPKPPLQQRYRLGSQQSSVEKTERCRRPHDPMCNRWPTACQCQRATRRRPGGPDFPDFRPFC